jgi:hypothetical protein
MPLNNVRLSTVSRVRPVSSNNSRTGASTGASLGKVKPTRNQVLPLRGSRLTRVWCLRFSSHQEAVRPKRKFWGQGSHVESNKQRRTTQATTNSREDQDDPKSLWRCACQELIADTHLLCSVLLLLLQVEVHMERDEGLTMIDCQLCNCRL